VLEVHISVAEGLVFRSLAVQTVKGSDALLPAGIVLIGFKVGDDNLLVFFVPGHPAAVVRRPFELVDQNFIELLFSESELIDIPHKGPG
jgi:hypothetical protein